PVPPRRAQPRRGIAGRRPAPRQGLPPGRGGCWPVRRRPRRGPGRPGRRAAPGIASRRHRRRGKARPRPSRALLRLLLQRERPRTRMRRGRLPATARRETGMETERPSPRYAAIELWSPAETLDSMIEGQFAAVAAVHAARAALERAALAIEQRLRAGGRLVYAGAGTSGRLAVQDGAELTPTFGWPAERLLLLIAGGAEALLRAVEGAEDAAEDGAALVRHHRINERDALIAVAASGTTAFTVECLREAAAHGALTVGIANNPNTPLL